MHDLLRKGAQGMAAYGMAAYVVSPPLRAAGPVDPRQHLEDDGTVSQRRDVDLGSRIGQNAVVIPKDLVQ